ncbi:MAG: DUF72 domain-containing protein [Ectothiorhodospiraceae bacterium]|nr:DUF72 domain-containing protein [Ectothiorhodospiraceae bacterium]MCH8503648.1 DUF72 domain-containing protein [Ectothiorhodospiraceae bacterium]
MTRWHLGTTGFSHLDWERSFYPSRLPAAGRLGWYSRQFSAVELEAGGRTLPSAERVAHWREATPEGFRFCLIAPNALTSPPGRLDSPSRLRQLERLLEVLQPLGQRLAVLLLHFPAECRHDRYGELQRLLGVGSAASVPFAIQFDHGSWWRPDVAELLSEQGVGWAYADEPDRSVATMPVDRVGSSSYRPRLPPRTADFLYLRWLGRSGQFGDLGREHLNPDARLQWWVSHIGEELRRHPAPAGVFGFFSNGYAGHAPASCRRFRQLLEGRETREVLHGQDHLF